jgi:hypothetical protein
MTLSNLNCALVQIASVLKADTASRDTARRYEDTAQAEFWAGRVAGLSQALTILAVIGEQPVESAKYLAGLPADVQGDAIAHLPDLQSA